MAYGSYGGYGSGGTMRSPYLRSPRENKSDPGNVYERAIRKKQESYNNPFQGIPDQLSGGYPAPTPAPVPAPTYTPGRIPAPTAAPSATPGAIQPTGAGIGALAPGAQTQGGGGIGGFVDRSRGDQPWNAYTAEPVQNTLSPENQQKWREMAQQLYAGGDYTGRHERAQMILAQYANFLKRLEGQEPVDFSVSSAIGDKYESARQRLMDQLAARGVSGSGVEAGALANTYGRQAADTGNLYSQLLEQRRRENLAQQLAFENRVYGQQDQGLQANIAEQNDPGFWGDVGGVLGGVVGSAIPGIGGGIGHAIGGLFGANQQPYQQPNPYGQPYGAPTPYYNPQQGQYGPWLP